MRLRTLIVAGLVITMVITVVTTVTLKARNNQGFAPTDDKYIPIVTRQLLSDDGALPVEIRCGTAHLSAPDTLAGFSCMVINNTKKKISALSTSYTIITQKDGQVFLDTAFLSSDSFVHPDVREARRLKMVEPGTLSTFEPAGPITYENAIIKSIEFKIDYIEFEDNTSLGPNENGARIINTMRDGAARYKQWLKQKYARNKDLTNTIAPLLEDSEIPGELKLDNMQLAEGARIYRKVMRNVYKTQGATALEKYLGR